MTPSDSTTPANAEAASLRRKALVEQVARRIESVGMTAPAVAFLEVNRPLAFLGSQMLLVAQPFLSPFLASVDGWVEILEDRGSVEQLVRRLEQGPPPAPPAG